MISFGFLETGCAALLLVVSKLQSQAIGVTQTLHRLRGYSSHGKCFCKALPPFKTTALRSCSVPVCSQRLGCPRWGSLSLPWLSTGHPAPLPAPWVTSCRRKRRRRCRLAPVQSTIGVNQSRQPQSGATAPYMASQLQPPRGKRRWSAQAWDTLLIKANLTVNEGKYFLLQERSSDWFHCLHRATLSDRILDTGVKVKTRLCC